MAGSAISMTIVNLPGFLKAVAETPKVQLRFMRSEQCSSTPCTTATGTLVATNTPARSITTHSSVTLWRTVVSAAGTYYYVVTAFDSGGQESAASSEIAVVRTGPIARTTR